MRRRYALMAATPVLLATLTGSTEAYPEALAKPEISTTYDDRQYIYADDSRMTISEADKQRLRETYAEIGAWSCQRVTARLVFVEGSDEFECERTDATRSVITSRNAPAYCPGPDAVVMPAAWATYIAPWIQLGDDGVERAANAWALAHETGHSLDTSDPALNAGNVGELRADCFAGWVLGRMARGGAEDDIGTVSDMAVAIQKVAPTQIDPAVREERVDAFMLGVSGVNCMAVSVR